MERWEGAPVVVYGGEGEVIPPPSSGHLKFTNASTFTSTRATATGHLISIPPDSQTAIPARLKAETLALVKRIMPSMLSDNRTVDYWRLCWDSITPTQDQLITRHPDPRLANLYLAVGGSFHSWKFLPIIGEYVVNVLEGRGNGKEMDERWGWKKKGWGAGKGKKGAHEKVVPTRELADLEERVKL
ncbi:FAD dependent oxidoreductase [Lasallia pustulata]|uniref:FAD dependent oxidoreductase n=1 Tax=Lasallia pustulata TaxID=136370 RepID=A0A1W5DBB8_9LECA|nr:FAD dependent oxidoreductase [Lasallia pustulata]